MAIKKPNKIFLIPILALIIICSFSNSYGQLCPTCIDSLDLIDRNLFDKEVRNEINNKNKFLYLVTKGQELSAQGYYAQSNLYFEKAFLMQMDRPMKHIALEEECYNDDRDLFMVLYYKAINFMALGSTDEALVECRRMDELLKETDNMHKSRILIGSDPLFYVLIGMIFEIGKEYDNSVFAYQKAKQLYEQEYGRLFTKHVPPQLEYDLQRLVSSKNINEGRENGEMIFIWHNGQCPAKLIIQRDFKIKCHDGLMVSNDSSQMPKRDYLGNLLLPFYKFNKPNFWSGNLLANGKNVEYELLEDLNWDSVRIWKERLAQNGIHLWRQGAEWGTLPQTMYYARIPLSKGINDFHFTLQGYGGSKQVHSFSCEGNGKIYIHVCTTLESK